MSDNDLSGLFPAPVTGLPRLPLSIKASTDSWSILFSFLTIISGAPSSSNLFNLLFLFITLLYKSFKSDVANLPPSNWTIGLKSGGITGTTCIIIHSGLLFESLNDSTVSNLFTNLALFCSLAFSSSFFNFSDNLSTSISDSNFLIGSAPISALNESLPNFSWASTNSFSESICPFVNVDVPLSVTIYDAKYITFSKALGETSNIKAILLGIPLKYQMWATGAASSMCPILSLLTLDFVTSTPHLSQTIPLYLTLLYLPQWHSQSFVGPNILSQNRPSFSGFNVL